MATQIRRFCSIPGVQWNRVFILAAHVAGYMAAISYARFPDLDSPKRIILFGVLWSLGTIALVLVTRLWRSILLSHE